MKKYFTNYISQGRGMGFFILFVLSFVLSVYYALWFRSFMTEIIPYVQEQADKFFPIVVQNGQITEPLNTVRESQILIDQDDDDNEYAFALVLDTTIDELPNVDLPDGIYVTRSRVYHVEKDQMTQSKLSGNYMFEKMDYTPMLKSFARKVFWGVVIVASVLYFIYFFVLVMFYFFVFSLIADKMKFETTTGFKLRFICVLFGLFVVLEQILFALGFYPPFGVFSLCVLVAGYFALRALKPLSETKTRRKKK